MLATFIIKIQIAISSNLKKLSETPKKLPLRGYLLINCKLKTCSIN